MVKDKKSIPVIVEQTEAGFDVTITARGYPKTALAVTSDWQLGDCMFSGTVNGTDVIVQVERMAVGYRLLHAGTESDVRVVGARAAELMTLMPKKRVADTSKLLQSPMPGLLLSLSAKPGQKVKAGEELAIIEAMKMENVMRAEQDATVDEVKVEQGQSLVVDQVILTFE